VIDVGCGSGILSIAAIKLGASHALAVDIDPLAMQASQQNALLNGVERQIELGVGSVDEIRSGQYSITHAPVVFANILAPIIIQLFEAGLGKLIAEPGGSGILSGILAEQSPGVEEAAAAHGFEVTERLQDGDWVALAIRRTGPKA
jgi:ribosomal protein L11 methyltransferase